MRNIALVLALVAMLLCAGCASVASPVAGGIFLDVKGPIDATANTAGSRQGEAMATSILGLIGQGDASIEAAAANGGITKISSVDHHSWSILGIYSKFTTIVHGD